MCIRDRANIAGYGLEELGIAAGRTIETNDFLQTKYPNIYAAGDVAGPFQFTHTAAHQAWYAAVNSLFDPFRTVSYTHLDVYKRQVHGRPSRRRYRPAWCAHKPPARGCQAG